MNELPVQDPSKARQKKKPHPADETVSLVAPPRENWNDIFSEITRLSNELEKLGIDIVMESDNA